MKAPTIIASFLLLLAGAGVAVPETPEEFGTRLLKQSDDRPVFERVRNKITINIYGASGELKFKKSMIMAAYTEKIGTPDQCEKYISYFLSPADDMGNSYLSYNYKNAPDEKYLYLKGIRKVKKVTGADQKLSFFGSDFTNGDVGKPNFDDWTYRYDGEQKVDFKGKAWDCYVVICKPRTLKIRMDLGYSKRVIYIEKKTMLTLKMDYFDELSIHNKELRLISFTTAPNVRGQKVFYETGIEMKNVKTGSRTELLMSETLFEAATNIRPEIFTTEYLTKKWW